MTLLEAQQSAEELVEFFRKGDYSAVVSLASPLVEKTANSPDLFPLYLKAKAFLADAYRFQVRVDEAIELGMEILHLCEHGDFEEYRAQALNTIGTAMLYLQKTDGALEYLFQALEVEAALGRQERIAGILCNIGNVYRNTNLDIALEYYYKALDALPEAVQTHFRGTILTNIAYTYNSLRDAEKALEMAYRALNFYVENGFDIYVIGIRHFIGILQWESLDFEHARDSFLECVNASRKFDSTENLLNALIMLGHCECEVNNLEAGEQCYREALSISQQMNYSNHHSGDANILNGIGGIEFKRKNYEKALEYYSQSVQKIEAAGTTQNPDGLYPVTLQMMAQCHFQLGHYSIARKQIEQALQLTIALGYTQVELSIRTLLDEILVQENNYEAAYTNQRRMIEISEALRKEDLSREIEKREVESRIANQEKQLAIERARFQEREDILTKILPEEITTRLIKGENPIADYFDSVSVLFMDIADFTPLAATISAQQLVHLLNAIFTAADGVMREFGLEKIKTIGDAYMAVAGAPLVQKNHAERAALAALALLEVMQNLVVTLPHSYGDNTWIESIPEIHIRIGVHCGSVAAGVVGENKFLYDLWGDAVNTAARMESHGEPGKIHVSEEFAQQLALDSGHWEVPTSPQKHPLLPSSLSFGDTKLSIILRGEMEIKGKGKMRTYFLEKA